MSGTDPFVVGHTSSIFRRKALELVRRPEIAAHEVEDIAQEMWVHLLTMRDRYDPARGSPEAFATITSRSGAGMNIRRRGRDKRRPDYIKTSLDTTIRASDDRVTTLADLLGPDGVSRRTFHDEEDPFEAVDLADEAEAIRGVLSDEDRELLEHVARYGISQTARLWSRTSERPVTRHRIRVALARLRARVEESQHSSR